MPIPIVEAWNNFINKPVRPEVANMFSKDNPYIHVDAIATTTNSGVDAARSSDGGYFIPAREGSQPASIRSIIAGSEGLSQISASGRAPSTPQQVVYTDAPYAEIYGMSAQTAYEEALLNTAHQREVADLKAAGLNPVLGISGSGASSGATPVLQGSGSINSGKSGKDNRFSDILPYVGAIAGTLIGAKYGHASSGLSSGKAAGEALKVLLE